jgi:hypothetical protein
VERLIGATRHTALVAIIALAAAPSAGAHGAASTHDAARFTPGAARSAIPAPVARHAAEHDAVDRAIRRFDRLPARRKRLIRQWLRGQDPATQRARRSIVDGAPAVVGRWTQSPFVAPDYAIHAVLLGDGRVLLFSMGSKHGVGPGSSGNNGQGLENDGQATVWDPARGTSAAAFTAVDPPPIPLDDPQGRPGYTTPRPAPLFCAGQVQMADGRVLIAGGNLEASGGGFGLRILFVFDPRTDSWVREPNMQRGRWYPTTTRLPSGRIAILGGQDEAGAAVKSFELYPADGLGIPGIDAGAATTGLATSEPAAQQDQGMYPFSFVLPTGRLAMTTWGAGPTALFEPTTGRWVQRTTANLTLNGSYATAFLRPGDERGSDEVISTGGNVTGPPPFSQPAVTANAWALAPERERAWRRQPPINVARRNATAVLLPDGGAVLVGGGQESLRFPLLFGNLPSNLEQRRVELWDAATGTWTLGPAAQVPRGYHSIALLLPDGRVLSGGDDFASSVLDTNRTDDLDSTLEIYSPPYLFRGNRPTIDAAPAAVGYGERIEIRASADRPIVRATLVAPGSVTHALDMNQRVLQLPLTDHVDGTYSITGPLTSGAAPPGDYMLFVLNDLGVPSVASWLRVRPSSPGQGTPVLTALPDEPVPTPTPAPDAAAARAAVLARLKAFFKDSAAAAQAGMDRLAKACKAPRRRARTARARAREAEALRRCRERAIR